MKPENHTRIVYFSHGGGPLPLLGDPGHQAMIDFMTELPGQFPRPDAILVVSAHWEEPVPTLLGAAQPPMFYDYYGFPPQAYQINYPANGHPDLAVRIASVLKQAGIPAHIDPKRGFDHGLFIPLSLMYPQADIPALQLSLQQGLSPQAHLGLGKALRGLEEENLLVIGSGFSFHNMSAFFHHDPAMITPRNNAFQDWLINTITADIPQTERLSRLENWETAPYARYCHPREEHLLPLHVCAGMAGRAGQVIFDDIILGVRCAAFLWQ
ncbi:MAG: DODA-type extradiol aromatic ring-opening family dioxygenase [Brevefilum sp.]